MNWARFHVGALRRELLDLNEERKELEKKLATLNEKIEKITKEAERFEKPA